MQSKWASFYKDRVNSSYQDYFEERYEPFLSYIVAQPNVVVEEIGCGIASCGKFLTRYGKFYSGFDNCTHQIELAKSNLPVADSLWVADLFKIKGNNHTLHISHGVLEHFDDDVIKVICNLYPNSIHYVPLDKYEEPSFGDERLLPAEHWLKITKPKEWCVFNDGYDLFFQL